MAGKFLFIPLVLWAGILLFTEGEKEPGVELVWDAQATLGEGAIWDPDKECLYWVDIDGQKLHIFTPKDTVKGSYSLDSKIGTVVPAANGGLVIALQKGIYRFDTNTRDMQLLSDPINDPQIRFNDGKCDPAGRFWVGTLAMDSRKKGALLYRLDRQGEITVMRDSVTISNGIVWSNDHTRMYYIDTPTMQVQQFSYDDTKGTISDPRTVVTIPAGIGAPDGMTIDRKGNLWVALWGGGAVACFDPKTGKMLQKINVPAPNVTSCAFGGKHLETLYITTARVWLSPEKLKAFPLSGGLFSVKPGVRGVAASYYINTAND